MIRNTILWGNTADEGNQVYIWTVDCIPGFSHSDIQGGHDSIGGVLHTGEYENCIDADPLFAGPPDYNLTWANWPVPDSTMSPCIDSGDPLILDPDGSISDIGAFFFDQAVGISDIRYQKSEIRIECWPNPTYGKSDIRYQISEVRSVLLTVYDITGKQLIILADETQNAGEHVLSMDISELPDGLYVIRLLAGKESAVGKVLVVH